MMDVDNTHHPTSLKPTPQDPQGPQNPTRWISGGTSIPTPPKLANYPLRESEADLIGILGCWALWLLLFRTPLISPRRWFNLSYEVMLLEVRYVCVPLFTVSIQLPASGSLPIKLLLRSISFKPHRLTYHPFPRVHLLTFRLVWISIPKERQSYCKKSLQ